MKTTYTAKELKLLIEISKCCPVNESGFSEFTNKEVKTKSRAGILSQLSQKGLVYDSYANEDDMQMWCLTPEGFEVLNNKLKIN